MTGFGRDADVKWNTVQHKRHTKTYSNNQVTKLHGDTLILHEREKAPGGLPAGITVEGVPRGEG